MQLLTALGFQWPPVSPQVISLVGGGGKTSTLFALAHELVAAGQRVITTTTTRIAPAQVAWAPAHLLIPGDELPMADIAQALDQHGHCLLLSRITAEKAIGLAAQLVDQLAHQASQLKLAAIIVEADGAKFLPAKAPAAHEPVLPTSTTLLMPVMGMDAIGEPIDADHVHRPEFVRQVLGLPALEDHARLTPAQAAQLLIDPQGGAKAQPAGARLLPLLNKAENPTRLTLARLIAHRLAASGQAALIGAVGIANTEYAIRHTPYGVSQLPHSAFPIPHADPILERWGAITAVVLAAGQSSRMGRPKQVEVVDGEPMVVRAVHVALQSGANEVLVVVGAYAEAVRERLSPLVETNSAIRLVTNDEYASGQASSIRRAVQALPPNCAGALFLPVDQPFVPPVLLQRLIRTWRSGARLVASSVDGQVRGAPALFDRTLWPDLLALTGDMGARSLFQKYHSEIVSVATDAHSLRDIDTPADL